MPKKPVMPARAGEHRERSDWRRRRSLWMKVMALAHYRGPPRRLARALLAAAVAAGAPAPIAAEDAPGKGALLVVDANSGRVMQQVAADAPRHPASLAKLMTLYLVFERIEQGRLSYRTPIRFSANAAAAAPSKLDLSEGAQIALIDAVKVLITKSANDVAVAIAERIAGSEAGFARLMTQKAHQLGMTATTFRNASGLPDDEQVTSARDMVTLALHLEDDFPKHYALFATRYFTYDGETFRNHNSLLFDLPGTDGLKTGYTQASGFNLIASVRRGRKHVVGVIFGGTSAASRDRAMEGYLLHALTLAASERTRSTVRVRVAHRPPREPPTLVPPAPQPVTRAQWAPSRAAAMPAPAGASAAPAAAPSSLSAPAAPTIAFPRVRQVLLAERTTANPAAAPQGIAALLGEADGQNAAASAAPGPEAARPAEARQMSLGRPEAVRAAEAPPAKRVAATSPASRRVAEATPTAAAQRGTGGFVIQIGAYGSQAEAERQLARARKEAPHLLAQRAPMTQQVGQGERLLFRARYGGFAAAAGAAEACQALQRHGFACLVVRGQ